MYAILSKTQLAGGIETTVHSSSSQNESAMPSELQSPARANELSAASQGLLNRLDAIGNDIRQRGHSVYADATVAAAISSAREEYLRAIRTLSLHPQSEKFRPEDLEASPWRKLAIGATNGVGDAYAQFLLTTYFSERSTQFPQLHALFKILIEIRNTLTDLPQDFGGVAQRDGFWNACRIHHYPSGGGFMAAHHDTHFPSVLKGKGLPFLQVMACMSKRGSDFRQGGGFLHDRDNTYVSTDTESSFGCLVFFDGSIKHGVDTVDPDRLLDLSSDKGRFAAFVNLYTYLP